MFWIALSPSLEHERQAWSWWALRFTPRVAFVEEALVLEVSQSLKLFGGRKPLLRLLLQSHPRLGEAAWAAGPSSLQALAVLRCKQRGIEVPRQLPDDLPIELLTAARQHAGLLERTGTRTWGQLRALPRGGLSRRFGAPLLQALDAVWGGRPEQYPWITLPESFDLNVELAMLAQSAPELMLAAEHLLQRLQLWLQARNRGVLALELEWTIDLRRLDGVQLPPREQLQVRTAKPTQDISHLRRLVREHLERSTLAAPANHLRLRSVETAPWGGATHSLLPDEKKDGERLHELVERLSIRLGEEQVVVPQLRQDHRPECKQAWVAASRGEGLRQAQSERMGSQSERMGGQSERMGSQSERMGGQSQRVGGQSERAHSVRAEPVESLSPVRPEPVESTVPARAELVEAPPGSDTDALYPSWILPQPLRLRMQGETPLYGGPLHRLARLYRVETAWWEPEGAALRDYFVARSPQAGLVWIYRERPRELAGELASSTARFKWYLQGLYA